MPPSIAHHLDRLAVGQAVDVDGVGLVRREPGQDVGGPVDRVAAHPGPSGVGALAVEASPRITQHPLAPGFDPAAGRLEQHGEVAGEQLGGGSANTCRRPLNSSATSSPS